MLVSPEPAHVLLSLGCSYPTIQDWRQVQVPGISGAFEDLGIGPEARFVRSTN
jgi:hypothetical protein